MKARSFTVFAAAFFLAGAAALAKADAAGSSAAADMPRIVGLSGGDFRNWETFEGCPDPENAGLQLCVWDMDGARYFATLCVSPESSEIIFRLPDAAAYPEDSECMFEIAMPVSASLSKKLDVAFRAGMDAAVPVSEDFAFGGDVF